MIYLTFFLIFKINVINKIVNNIYFKKIQILYKNKVKIHCIQILIQTKTHKILFKLYKKTNCNKTKIKIKMIKSL